MPETRLRGKHLFKAIGRRLAKQNSEDSADSETNSEKSSESHNLKERSTNTLRRMMASLSIRNTKKTPQHQKSILRQPTSYTYMKGVSGLPVIMNARSKSMRY